jgi:cytochrome c553
MILVLPLILLTSCEKEENMSRYDPPADHTVSQDGAMHKSGFDQPLSNCTNCHGADLQGGNVEVSCFECHGKKW